MKPEITKTEDQTSQFSGRIVLIPFGVLIALAYFLGLNLPFVGPDEPRYAQVAREMFNRGDWITPTLGTFNWFEKPPLLYWLEMVSYKLFGVNELAARLGPALCGLGTIASLWFLGKSISIGFASTRKCKIDFAHLTALIAASTLGIMAFSHGASFDIVITFSLTAALVNFFVFDQRMEAAVPANLAVMQPSPRALSPLFLFYVFTGLALLAKGLIGIVFPFAIIGMFYLSSRRMPNRMFVISLFWGTLLAVAIASVWYLPMYQRHGYQFFDQFFIQHHFQRFTTNKYEHSQPFYFFFWVLPLMTLPWFPFFLVAVWKFVNGIFYRGDTETQRDFPATSASRPLLIFLFCWLLVPLLFFSFSGSKLPGYILPAVPAAVTIASIYIFALVCRSPRWHNAVAIIATSTFVIAILVVTCAFPQYADSDSVKSQIEAANKGGHESSRVLMFETISHNAEYYAAGRLLRDIDGKQRRLSTVVEVINEIDGEDGHAVLVLIPLEYLPQLTTNEQINTNVLKDNGKLAIVAVTNK